MQFVKFFFTTTMVREFVTHLFHAGDLLGHEAACVEADRNNACGIRLQSEANELEYHAPILGKVVALLDFRRSRRGDFRFGAISLIDGFYPALFQIANTGEVLIEPLTIRCPHAFSAPRDHIARELRRWAEKHFGRCAAYSFPPTGCDCEGPLAQFLQHSQLLSYRAGCQLCPIGLLILDDLGDFKGHGSRDCCSNFFQLPASGCRSRMF